MEKIIQYRQYIKQLLSDYASKSPSDQDVEAALIFDSDHDHYQVVYTGWKNRQPMYGCVLHMSIKNNKIWIHHDGTEIGFANELVKLGVPKTDIVLAFQEPAVRQYTDFAVD
ncbi:XisI protein [Moorena producens JHB]|uniref:XisI protein n=1 Tax=Moorena producens (strain JHB) TaxID=1454205 RepID=A0A1D9FX52_MOOP1|nr:XisI protein [Moorena producens]AOY79968.1 XisI protein [Moorena producens JHB]